MTAPVSIAKPLLLLTVVSCANLKHGVVFWEKGCPDGTRHRSSDDGRRMGTREWCEIPSGRTTGVLHGPWMRTWPDGTVRRQGQYDNGKQVGTWTSYHADGTRMQTTEWRANEVSGEQQRWHRNGKTMWRGWIKSGRRQGHWAGFFADGTKAWLGQFKEGRPYGEWIFYTNDGSVALEHDFGELLPVPWWNHERPCPDSATLHGRAPPDGLHIECREQPKESLTAVRHGPFTDFFGDGSCKLTGHYRHGDKDGRWITWRENGSPRLLETWRDGELMTPLFEWDRDGVLRRTRTSRGDWTRAWCPTRGTDEDGDWWNCE